jgi:predicted transport protein
VIDENKPEFQEIMETYTDTWDKMVKIEILKQYTANKKIIFTLNPDFEGIELVESLAQEESEEKYTEKFHLEDISEDTQKIYQIIKENILRWDSNIKINPQKYYISLRDKKNFTYLSFRKKKIKIAVILPFEIGQKMIKNHKLRQFTEGIQKFYGAPSFEVTVENQNHIKEILNLLKEAHNHQLE